MKIEKFEDIKAWQSARELVNKIYNISGIGGFEKDYSLKDQVRRAVVSIMANIAEGFDSSSPTEFIRFLVIARRSATELQSHLYVAFDRKYIDKEQFDRVYNNAVEVKNLIYGFIRYLKTKK